MKISKDERGGLSPIIIIVVVVVLAAVGYAGWRVFSKKKSTTGNGSSSSVSAPATTAADKQLEDACMKEVNDKNLCKFASHFTLTTAYTMNYTTVDSSGTTTGTFSTDGKNNSTMTTKQDGKETAAFISLNKDSYVKDEASGVWTKYSAQPSQTTPETNTNPSSDIKIDSKDITDNNKTSYKNLGKEGCGKLTCFKYQVIDTTTPNTTQYIWFDDHDYQMRRWYSKDENGSNDMTLTYQAVNITAPSPVKEFNPANLTQ